MKKIILLISLLLSAQAEALCPVFNSQGQIVESNQDGHFLILSQMKACPQNVMEYKNALLLLGLSVQPSMVANRGRNNPKAGSFSFFEEVTGLLQAPGTAEMTLSKGEFFFGHFTKKTNAHQIDLDQEPQRGQLLIELIAWDSTKEVFNFYELIGQGGSAKWFYRGDSFDILKDNELLYRSQPVQFGQRLRCSACHTSGGPIMKELAPPHNDWWTEERPLTFRGAVPSAQMKSWMDHLQDASSFSLGVQAGILKLHSSSGYQQAQASLTLQEQLRPLFCDTEINIESSEALHEQKDGNFGVSSSAFLNPFFGKSEISFSAQTYEGFLAKFQLRFPENQASDADHKWLVPVKGYSDLLAIQYLVQRGILDQEFVYDVLAVDVTNSLFSESRCELLQLVPNESSSDWKADFVSNLKASSWPSAQRLLLNMTDPAKNKEAHLKAGQKYLQGLQSQGLSEPLFVKLLKDREAVFHSDISKNPLGQILEPGFRVIFPEPTSQTAPLAPE